MTLIEKLMRVANDPSATPAERETYRRKAEELRAKNPHPQIEPTRVEFDYLIKCGWTAEQIAEIQVQINSMWHATIRPDGSKLVCCCTRAGATARDCGISRNLKHPCRCACHPRKAK